MEIPEPKFTGSDGTQKEEKTPIDISNISPIEGLPIAQTVEGLAATRARSMGGEVAANLLAASFTQMSQNFQEAKKELRNALEKLEKIREELSECRTKSAVLQERIKTYLKGRYLKNFVIMIATALIATGIDLYRNNFDKASYLVLIGGILLLIIGWLLKEGGTDQ